MASCLLALEARFGGRSWHGSTSSGAARATCLGGAQFGGLCRADATTVAHFGLLWWMQIFCVRPQLLSQHVASWLRSDRLARQREIVQKCEEFLVGKETLPQTEQHGHRCIPLVATLFMWTTDGQMENFKNDRSAISRNPVSAWRLWRSSRKPPLRRRTRSSWLHHDRSYQRACGLPHLQPARVWKEYWYGEVATSHCMETC